MTKKFREFFESLADALRSRDPIVQAMHVGADRELQAKAQEQLYRRSSVQNAIWPPMFAIIPEHQPVSLMPGSISYARAYRDLDEQAMCEIEGRPFDGKPRAL